MEFKLSSVREFPTHLAGRRGIFKVCVSKDLFMEGIVESHLFIHSLLVKLKADTEFTHPTLFLAMLLSYQRFNTSRKGNDCTEETICKETRLLHFRHRRPGSLLYKFRLQEGSGFSFDWISELSRITPCKASKGKAGLLLEVVIFLPGVSH